MSIMHRYVLIILIILIILLIILFCTDKNDNKINGEHFEAIVRDGDFITRITDLTNFFQFVEYHQSIELTPESYLSEAGINRTHEKEMISNNIRDLLNSLKFMINVNNKDNFYHRFIINYVGSNLDYNQGHPLRRINFDEMVRDKIGRQFTIHPENEFDKYYPRPNLDSKHQGSLPHTINVHNYYTYENIQINLVALKMLLEMVQEKNHDVFAKIVRPSEHDVFETEFIAPIEIIKNSILNIVNAHLYKEYIHNQKFNTKYLALMD